MGQTDFDTIQAADVKRGADSLHANHYQVLDHYIAGAQTAAAKKFGWIVPFAGTIVDVRAYFDTAPTGATALLDVNKNGTTIFTTQANRPTIAISGNASTTAAPDVTAVAAGDRLTFDVDQVGSTVAGSDLYIAITLRRANVSA